MTESRLNITINGRDYPMACEPGEEEKVAALGKKLDAVVRKVAVTTGPIAESRLLVMAGLIIAADLADLEEAGAGKAGAAGKADAGDEAGKALAARVEELARRLEKLASGAG